MITLNRVSFSYENDGACTCEQTLSSLSFQIESGEFLCIAGPSGCGKTTLLRLLAGLHAPTEGTILVDGDPVTGPREDMAIVFQDYALFPWMSARKNVQFSIRQTHRGISASDAAAMADRFLDQVGMLGDANKHPYQMSGGMRQRVAIARALAMDRRILLLDEPFGALDAKNRTDLQNLLETLWYSSADLETWRTNAADPETRKTIVFVTHDIQEAVRLADRVLLMEPGGVAEVIPVPLKRPRTIMDGPEADAFRQIRRDLTDKLMELDKPAGRACKCGGPA